MLPRDQRLTRLSSPLPHHLSAATRSRSKPRRAADLYSRAAKYARANHKVRQLLCLAVFRRKPLQTNNPSSCSFMCHPEMLLHIPTIDDPTERFVSVVKFYLSGWHIRPPYVPLVAGCYQRCYTCYTLLHLLTSLAAVSRSLSTPSLVKPFRAIGISTTISARTTSQNRRLTILPSRATFTWLQITTFASTEPSSPAASFSATRLPV